ncbi:MAG TPA: FAD-dependent monooxygenase, partial [Anaerolineales bacterium]|nr:FAD-dependent monooxygenase [Anaerolineales bacterium]
MSNENNFDVIIVGGGPAGSTAAYLLKQQSLDVLIIDKDKFPRMKLCGGLLTDKTLKILDEIYGDTIQTLIDKGVINYVSYSYELRTKDEIWNAGHSAIPSVIVNRYIYDHYLLNRSLEAGAHILHQDRVTKVDISNNTVTTISGKTLKAKIIIGADGANSVVRKAMNKSIYDPQKWIKGLATGLEVTIPRANVGLDVSGPIIFFDIVPWGYGWVFPNK